MATRATKVTLIETIKASKNPWILHSIPVKGTLIINAPTTLTEDNIDDNALFIAIYIGNLIPIDKFGLYFNLRYV